MTIRGMIPKVAVAVGAMALLAGGYAVHSLLQERRALGLLDEAARHQNSQSALFEAACNRLEAMGPRSVRVLVREAIQAPGEERSALAAALASHWLISYGGRVTPEESRVARAQLLACRHLLTTAIRDLVTDQGAMTAPESRAYGIGRLAALSGDTTLVAELAKATLLTRHDSTGADLAYALRDVLEEVDMHETEPTAVLIASGTLRTLLYSAPAGSRTRRAAAWALMHHMTRTEAEGLRRDPDRNIAEAGQWAIDKALFVGNTPEAAGLQSKKVPEETTSPTGSQYPKAPAATEAVYLLAVCHCRMAETHWTEHRTAYWSSVEKENVRKSIDWYARFARDYPDDNRTAKAKQAAEWLTEAWFPKDGGE